LVVSIGLTVAVVNFLALIIPFCIDKFAIRGLPWDHVYMQDFVSFLISAITILVISVLEGLPVAVMVSLAYSVKVRRS